MTGLIERLQGLRGEVDMTPHDAVLDAAAAGRAAGVLQKVRPADASTDSGGNSRDHVCVGEGHHLAGLSADAWRP